MDDCVYDPTSKQIFLRFSRTVISVELEEFMDVLYCLQDAKRVIEADPEVSLAEYTDEDGKVWQEFIVNDTSNGYN